MPAVRWYAPFSLLICEILSSAGLQEKGSNASLIARLLEEHDATRGSADDVEIFKEIAAIAYVGEPMFSDCQILKLNNDT
jgi:hypothetical protein